MASYTTDDDLVPIYVAQANVLPDSLLPLHEEAYRQIRRDLAAQGWTTDDLDALTDGTLEAIKVPSCHYVMHLHWQSQTHDPGGMALDRAKYHLDQYGKTLATTPIDTTLDGEDDTPTATGGYTVLA